MSTNALRGKSSAPTRPGDGEIAIGDSDRQIFNCPVCQRPLPTGATRCLGCGARLLFGIRAGKATALLGSGAVTGAIVGGLMVAIVLLGLRPAATVAGPIGVVDQPRPTAPGAATPPPVPSRTANALVRTSGLNVRLATQRSALAAAVKPSKPKVSVVAPILRAIASDASLAAEAVPALAAWPEGRILAAELRSFYANVQATASKALDVSLRDSASYRRNGVAMVALLDHIAELQAASQTLAEANGIELAI
jgi:hypothetical protein